jgi:hypothetical protein
MVSLLAQALCVLFPPPPLLCALLQLRAAAV